ncbi:hypothetical protein [Bdellovibrio bacteriovorus]|uniref:hypothetical protein n=1 Tax=Bdellovibrio bacteriovorus TaxID=959 RepID=UPI00045BE823|nr:hypothetical protein [Bdellovibrio bacteriovorus]AHZ85385.1 hypothetical protein EP01_10605 [Bdellovibrio bacteriovorus]BEV69279.1 hypothetical protein Bb109J_c2699 [Bdellovibrio bacteriovorus]
MKLILILITIALLGSPGQAAVWTDTNQWSAEWENQYSAWVKSEWNRYFFSRRLLPNGQANPYYGLRVDCADAVYSMRLIFAYEHRLPFVIKDPTYSSSRISNKMSRWDRLREIERVRSFLLYVHETTSTRSLPGDTYPVAISRKTIRSGGILATTAVNHHSWTVKEILPIGVPYLVYNSVVGSHSGFTMQERKSWPNANWVFEGNYSSSSGAGFRAWRPIASLNRPVWEVPGYSTEQFQISLQKWTKTLQSRLATQQEGDTEMVSRLVDNVCVGFKDRVSYVNEALSYKRQYPSCMSYEAFDIYSSPSRDERIFDDLMLLRRSYKEILQRNSGRDLTSEQKDQLAKIFPYINQSPASEARQMPAQNITEDSVCVVNYLASRSMDMAEFKRRLFLGWLSNNPNERGEYRWGVLRGPSDHARYCPSWGGWSPSL